MLAMQYSFTFPADYDMTIIERRVADKGYLMDGFPLLGFKAFLYARRDATVYSSAENLYAPFYLWQDNEGLNSFLASAGFAALVRDFGWPVVRVWSVLNEYRGPALRTAKWATRELVSLPAYVDLAELARTESARSASDIGHCGALAAVTAYEPTTWSLVRLRLWAECPPADVEGPLQYYALGHLATAA